MQAIGLNFRTLPPSLRSFRHLTVARTQVRLDDPLAAGAIPAFGVVLDSTVGSATVEWATIGWILMGVGVLGLIVSMVMISTARRREVVTHDRVIERDPI